MIFFPWTMECSIGVIGLDNEHWQLMDLINTLYEKMLSGTAAETANDIIDGLLAYADLHLKHEEDAMIWADYPLYDEHKSRHDYFRSTTLKFRDEARAAQGDLAMIDVTRELAAFLKDWLEQHIKNEDKIFGKFLNAKGIR